MKITLRLETEKDHKIVENLTREAFWNNHVPGCDEHLLIHNLRKSKTFINQLDYVALYNNEIVGNIVYMKAQIISNDVEHSVLTFGPISVLPEYQNKGIGSKLISHTIQQSKEMGYKAIIIYGDLDYYRRFGFKISKEYNITNKEKKFPAALLVLELYPNALMGIEGIFFEGEDYEVNQDELIEFDKKFPKKDKEYSKTQDRFNELSGQYL